MCRYTTSLYKYVFMRLLRRLSTAAAEVEMTVAVDEHTRTDYTFILFSTVVVFFILAFPLSTGHNFKRRKINST